MFAVPAVADEAPAAAKPIRHRAVERAPVREAAPAQMAAAQPSWTGAQVGGQGGISSMAQGFAEPGAFRMLLSVLRCALPVPLGKGAQNLLFSKIYVFESVVE
jgi:hypothetical protein